MSVWLIKGWAEWLGWSGWGGGGSQPDAGPAAAWLCGRGDTLKIRDASKEGLSQTLRGDNPYFIYTLVSFPTTCRATQPRRRACILHDTEIESEAS